MPVKKEIKLEAPTEAEQDYYMRIAADQPLPYDEDDAVGEEHGDYDAGDSDENGDSDALS